MRTLEEAVGQFGYHPATEVTAPKHADVRSAYIEFVKALWDTLPDGPEKTICLRKLQESAMYANLSIALTVPLDLDTPQIARVLRQEAP